MSQEFWRGTAWDPDYQEEAKPQLVKLADTHSWEEFDWEDLQPLPGSFLSREPAKPFEVEGRTVTAFTWLHARYLWLKQVIAESGEAWGVCCHCNHAIRYAVIFQDPSGHFHMVGQDCAEAVRNKSASRKDWSEKKRFSEIKQVETRNGTRYVLSAGEVPSWYWSLPRESRPRYCSTSKYGEGRRQKWYLSIWGESPEQVIENWRSLQALKPL